MSRTLALTALVLALALGVAATASAQPSATSVGKQLFFDATLSNPIGQACADCHAPGAGFADPVAGVPVSEGAVLGRFGNRNAPSAAYASFIPARGFDAVLGAYVGGQFWDGRADSLEEQAKGPFLNPLEMHMSKPQVVVARVARSAYADDFRAVFGADSLSLKTVGASYDNIAAAIAAFERSSELNPFTSKHDYAMTLVGPPRMMTFTPQEREGMMLFNGPKAKCSTCHVTPMSGMGGGGMGGGGMGGGGMGGMPWIVPTEPILFSDFRFANLGIPKNWESPFLTMPPAFNPAGMAYVDHGLAADLPGGVAANPEYDGMFRTPSLRNVAVTAPYGHNGYFKTLKEIVRFYNTRDVADAGWPAPEVPGTVDTQLMGDLGLTDAEEDAIVAFLTTLTDGWWQTP